MIKVNADNNTLNNANEAYKIVRSTLNEEHLGDFRNLINFRSDQFRKIESRNYGGNTNKMISDITKYQRIWLEKFKQEAVRVVSQLGLSDYIPLAYMHIINNYIGSQKVARRFKANMYDCVIHREFIEGKSSKVSSILDFVIMAAFSTVNYKTSFEVIDSNSGQLYSLESTIETLYGSDLSVTNMLYIEPVRHCY